MHGRMTKMNCVSKTVLSQEVRLGSTTSFAPRCIYKRNTKRPGTLGYGTILTPQESVVGQSWEQIADKWRTDLLHAFFGQPFLL